LIRALVAAVREVAQRRTSEASGRRGNVGTMNGGKAA
jgi:ribosomal protein S12 methylthiotransferase accessory factor YcaO